MNEKWGKNTINLKNVNLMLKHTMTRSKKEKKNVSKEKQN